jgi:hypothetical protein
MNLTDEELVGILLALESDVREAVSLESPLPFDRGQCLLKSFVHGQIISPKFCLGESPGINSQIGVPLFKVAACQMSQRPTRK